MEIFGLKAIPVLIVCVLVYLVNKFVTYSKLRHIPGPPLTGFLDLLHIKALLGDDAHTWYADVCEKYGSVARIGPNHLATSSPDVWAHVNKHKGYKRSDWYYHALRIEHQRDNVFSQTDNEKHDQRRTQMIPGYSGRENLDLENSIDECVSEFISLIRSKYISTEQRIIPMDLAIKVQYFTLDVISNVGLGAKFGMLQSDSDVDDYLKSSTEGLDACRFGLATGLSWFAQAPVLGKYLIPSHEDATGFGRMMAACFRAVDARAARSTEGRSDMLASFIRHGITGDELRSEALEQIVAGSDTTAASIRGILLHVMTNPRVYAKLQREIDEVSVVDGHIISLAQARTLPYLQAVIREGIRIWPPVTNYFSRDVPKGGDFVPLGNGKTVYLPGGTCIGQSATALHHSVEVYGDDAKTFRPERWFEKDSDKLEEMTRVSELMFGYGRFKCLGKPVAQLEISKVVFELLRRFDIAIADPIHPWDARNLMGLFSISDMWVQVMERPSPKV